MEGASEGLLEVVSISWALAALAAMVTSSLLAGIYAFVINHQEQKWKGKVDYFQLQPDSRKNPYELLQLNPVTSQVDTVSDTCPNFPYLQAPWAQGSHNE